LKLPRAPKFIEQCGHFWGFQGRHPGLLLKQVLSRGRKTDGKACEIRDRDQADRIHNPFSVDEDELPASYHESSTLEIGAMAERNQEGLYKIITKKEMTAIINNFLAEHACGPGFWAVWAFTIAARASAQIGKLFRL
jgi:hypothetical protein